MCSLLISSGTSDSVVKWRCERELEARINAQLRNKKYIGGINNHENDFFDVNIKNHTIAKGNKEVLLSRKEMDLLILLIEISINEPGLTFNSFLNNLSSEITFIIFSTSFID